MSVKARQALTRRGGSGSCCGRTGITRWTPSAVILDLMMPNLDGFSLIETLAKNDPSRLSQIIVTSAASPAVIRDRMKGTPFQVLPKPFDITELVAHVKACVELGE